MSFLPPDPPLETAPRTPKAPAESVLSAPRLPVTRWNRRYLAAGGVILATVIAVAFWIGFSPHPIKKADAKQTDDSPVSTPAFPDKYARGYGDPAVQRARKQAEAARSSSPFFNGAGQAGPPAAAAMPVAFAPGAAPVGQA